MRIRFFIRDLLWLTFVVAVAGCSEKVKTPAQLTLYSIDVQADFQERGHGRFHGYPVLGKIQIASEADREQITRALMDGISNSDKEGLLPNCFWPRHAIQMVDGGETTEYVICFQCLQIEVYKNNQKTMERTTKVAKPLLNDYLRAAEIQLASEPGS